jgi:hypothetical protein
MKSNSEIHVDNRSTPMNELEQQKAEENIRQVTAQSVAGAEQVGRTAGDLSLLATQLPELVAQYHGGER